MKNKFSTLLLSLVIIALALPTLTGCSMMRTPAPRRPVNTSTKVWFYLWYGVHKGKKKK